MRAPDWQSPDGSIRLYCGDCLEILPTLEAGSVDAVVTDPPYIIGATSVGNAGSKSGTWADMENAAWWFAMWFRESKRLLSDSGYLVSCGNWRSVPTLICALARCEWSATSCLIWDKQWIGPAYKNALRPTYELAIFAAMPNAEIIDRCASDIFRGVQWMAGQKSKSGHPAEKPSDLMEHIVGLTTSGGSTILDPFMGSGTTGVACIRTGRQFIGIEKETKYFEIAVKRIEDELSRQPLFAGQEGPL